MDSAGQQTNDAIQPISVAFLLVDRFSMIAFSSAIEPLRLANREAGRPLYRFKLFSEEGEGCCASNGIDIRVDGRFADATGFDMLLVCGGVDIHALDHRRLNAALRLGVTRGAVIGALCTGSYVLAQAGLLDGYRATVHWENKEGLLLERADLTLSSELFEIDRKRVTCAGGTAAADMVLALITRDHGPDLASAVAEQLILHRIREPGERQRTDLCANLGIAHPKLLRVISLMEQHVDEPLSNLDLADAVHLSTRQLERLFIRYLNLSPAKFYLKIRLERARKLIRQTALPLMAIAMDCGFTSASHFSKAYLDHFGRPPSTERKVGQRATASA